MTTMQRIDQLPDQEKLSALESALQHFKNARANLNSAERHLAEGGEVAEKLSTAGLACDQAIGRLQDEMDAMPTWDEALVRKAVLDNAAHNEVTRLDDCLVVVFDVAPAEGPIEEFRYTFRVTSGSEWLEVRDGDGDWTEVWSN